jgi:hypothetical protein
MLPGPMDLEHLELQSDPRHADLSHTLECMKYSKLFL